MSAILPIRAFAEKSKYDFEAQLRRNGIELPPLSIDTLQVNVTKLCNQVCRHCHVDASPKRTEMLSPEGVAKCLEILERHPQITKLDITGGAPELHPGFTPSSRRPSRSASTSWCATTSRCSWTAIR